MNGKVAKKAAIDEPTLEMRQRRKWFGEVDKSGQKIIRAIWGTLRHREGTPRQTYKKLKTVYKGGLERRNKDGKIARLNRENDGERRKFQ